MDNKLRRKALSILVKFPSISSYELAGILCIDERQARKLIKNLPQDIIEENIRKIKQEKKEEKQEDKADKKSQIGATLKGSVSIHKDGRVHHPEAVIWPPLTLYIKMDMVFLYLMIKI